MAIDLGPTRSSTILLFFFLIQLASAFYIPGWSIRSWSDGESIPLFVNKAYSDRTEIQYAYSELPFVCPSKGRPHGTGFISGNNVALNLGEVLRGDRIVVSDYDLEMGKDDEAHFLCSQKVDRAGLRKAIEIVKDGYVAEWIVDNLPGATSFVTVDKSKKYYASGFKMGYEDFSAITGQPTFYINNHVTMVIRYHMHKNKKVIVGFEVYAKSIEVGDRAEDGLPADMHSVRKGLELTMNSGVSNSTKVGSTDNDDPDATLTIPYTYSVYYREDDKVDWQTRWDLYFVNQEESTKIHWLSIVNSIVIAAVLSAIVVVILTRTITRDIKGLKDGALEDGKVRGSKRLKSTRSPRKSIEKGGLLEQPDAAAGSALEDDILSDDELPEDITGWKLVHGDVFRTPAFGTVLASLIGSGCQLVLMSVGLIILACFGVLNPSFRGGFISVGFALFIAAGAFSGYFSARIYKTFGGTVWKQNAFITATLFPGLLFVSTFILNLFVWAQASSTAIPLTTLLGLVALWVLIQLPLVYVGSWFGFVRAGAYSHPIKATAVPRQIPYQAWYSKSVQTMLLAGLIPFAVIFIELLFVFRSMWQDKSGYYYVFGFMAVVSVILVLAVMETTVIAVYIQLCAENYHWWWSSFFVGASSAVWIFGYCIYYFFVHLHITGLGSTLLFFAYAFLACTVYGLLMGTIGFLTAYAFVRRIYGAVKVD